MNELLASEARTAFDAEQITISSFNSRILEIDNCFECKK